MGSNALLGFDTNSTDKKILTGALIVLLLSISLILDDRFLFQMLNKEQMNLKPIASISEHSHDVRRRLESNLVWYPVKKKMDLYEGDSIFTGEKSDTEIVFKDGSKLKMDADGLIVIHVAKNQTTLDIKKGSISGKLDSKQKLVLKNRGKELEISSSNAEIRASITSQGTTQLSVLSGHAELKTGGIKSQLAQNQQVDLKSTGELGEIVQFPVELSSPAVDKDFETSTANIPVEFKWKSTGTVSSLSLELSQDSSFKKNVIRLPIRDQNHEISYTGPFTNGSYYWRITGKNSKGVETTLSHPQKFSITLLNPPTPVSPEPGWTTTAPRVQSKTSPMPVQFFWQEEKNPDGFEIQIAGDSSFGKVLHTGTPESSNWSSPPLTPGSYYWRVRSITKGKTQSQFSAPRQFKILEKALLPPPKIKKRIIHFEVSELKQGFRWLQSFFELWIRNADPAESEPELELNWDGVEGAKEYRIEISRSTQFTEDVVDERVSDPQFRWKNPDPAEYFWRVTAVDEQGNLGEPSSVGTLDIQLRTPEQPRALFPRPREKFVIEKKAKPEIKLRWTASDSAKTYQIQVARDPEFKSLVLDRKTHTPELLSLHFPEGNLYWHVRAETPRASSDWSPRRTFTIQQEKETKDRSPASLLPDRTFGPETLSLAVGLGYSSLTATQTNSTTGTPVTQGTSSGSTPTALFFNGEYWFLQKKVRAGISLDASYQATTATALSTSPISLSILRVGLNALAQFKLASHLSLTTSLGMRTLPRYYFSTADLITYQSVFVQEYYVSEGFGLRWDHLGGRISLRANLQLLQEIVAFPNVFTLMPEVELRYRITRFWLGLRYAPLSQNLNLTLINNATGVASTAGVNNNDQSIFFLLGYSF